MRVFTVMERGYGSAGASARKRALKGFNVESGSAREDIDEHNSTLRQRARMLYMSSPLATSAIRTNRTNVVGSGLKLKARVNRAALGLSQEAADAWEKKAEAEFDLWAGQKRACDATGVNDFYAMQQLALLSWLLSGDSFALVKRVDPTVFCPYGLRLHLIEADRISTPLKASLLPSVGSTEGKAVNGNRIYDGVEVDGNGAIVAYHVSDRYPGSSSLDLHAKWQRVAAYGERTGVANVLHVMDSERPEQYRGVSYLAQIIEPLLQIRRYTESELMAAVVQSFFTVFITSERDALGEPDFLDTPPDGELAGESAGKSAERDVGIGPGLVNRLDPGEDIKLAESKHPAAGFAAFVRAMSEQMGAALEIPADLLLKAFNASYSASRAALLEAWKAFRMRREWFVSDFCRPVYEIWMAEAVAAGRLVAPGFFVDPQVRAAWLGSEWIGPSQGQLDPVKEINAEIRAIEQGITTREQATVKLNGGQWDANVEQLALESSKLAEVNGLKKREGMKDGEEGAGGV